MRDDCTAIDGMDADDSASLIAALADHILRPEFIYRHHWSAGMLTLWDNRCVLHAATGGYEGFDRLLHRITIAGLGH